MAELVYATTIQVTTAAIKAIVAVIIASAARYGAVSAAVSEMNPGFTPSTAVAIAAAVVAITWLGDGVAAVAAINWAFENYPHQTEKTAVATVQLATMPTIIVDHSFLLSIGYLADRHHR